MSEDQPAPRPPVPSPAALARRVAPRPPAAAPAPAEHSESARFGRVDDEGRVFVSVDGGEQEVGSYPGATPEEALQYFARKYDELAASAELLQARLGNPEVTAKEVSDALATLKEHLAQANVVGDLPALHATVERVEAGLEAKRGAETEQRRAARALAATEREQIVAEAEAIAAQPPGSTQWKQSGERMRALLDRWKEHQRGAAKLDKPTEAALWQRFSHARNAFDKARRAWFAELETTREQARSAKEALVAEAEALASSTDWGATARAYKQLMDRWRRAGRAARAEDDALWERFRSAQDAFFTAKDSAAAAEDEEYRGNLVVKEELLLEAEAILPVTDVEAAKSALRGVQERWEAAGKVPRGDLDRVEKRLRRVEAAVREADERKWRATNPELSARAQSMVEQLEAAVAKAQAEVDQAQAAGDERTADAARERLAAQQQWLSQARAGVDEFGG
ncbi:DUF349 domain-containing protein [Phycicoccus endophyticus]|uniref:DUF349 domain-containing protein n=1 Tax=Phycicoccus endophyticus TaxID=1690220 RepID=UPI00198AF99B|nr:DUF349 domain-containing protein [Phycicoccus endophyticus]GGL23497.1 hypothetical protein GCM10012283_01990 [Phycicoccus endophyticus]